MSNVTAIFGGPTGVPSRDENAVTVLRDLLERAEAGEVVAVAVAAMTHDGLASCHTGGLIGAYSMIGALEVAKADVMAFFLQSP